MLKTVQPITNLQNYSKNITPVLNSGREVILTKNGKICGKISTVKQAQIDEDNKDIVAHLFVRYLHKINQKSYPIKKAEKMLKKL